jgi:hypothetical protein
VLEVLSPVSFVTSSVLMGVNSISVGFIVSPVSFEDVAINMPKLAFSLCFVQAPSAFVFSPVWPYLNPLAVSHVAFPLSLVDSSVFEHMIFLVLHGQGFKLCFIQLSSRVLGRALHIREVPASCSKALSLIRVLVIIMLLLRVLVITPFSAQVLVMMVALGMSVFLKGQQLSGLTMSWLFLYWSWKLFSAFWILEVWPRFSSH